MQFKVQRGEGVGEGGGLKPAKDSRDSNSIINNIHVHIIVNYSHESQTVLLCKEEIKTEPDFFPSHPHMLALGCVSPHHQS